MSEFPSKYQEVPPPKSWHKIIRESFGIRRMDGSISLSNTHIEEHGLPFMVISVPESAEKLHEGIYVVLNASKKTQPTSNEALEIKDVAASFARKLDQILTDKISKTDFEGRVSLRYSQVMPHGLVLFIVQQAPSK